MLIAIDHGNKQIKTSRRIFVSGLRESDTKPPLGKEVLFYKGKYYTLTDQRIPYMRDKTVDERYFILTLFAVAFELAGTDYRQDEIADVHLSIGLPPAHYGAQYERFENYFLNRDIIDFHLDGKPYSIYISKAICFPQAYAAIMPIYQRIRQYSKVAVLDIGEFTADYLIVKNGEADLSAIHWITVSLPSITASNPRSMQTLICCWTSLTLMLSCRIRKPTITMLFFVLLRNKHSFLLMICSVSCVSV